MVFFANTIGTGSAIVIGSSFWDWTDDEARVLANAVQYWVLLILSLLSQKVEPLLLVRALTLLLLMSLWIFLRVSTQRCLHS